MIAPQHSIQDNPPDDLLAKLRECLDYKCQEIIQESAIDPVVAWERGYYLEKTKAGLRACADRLATFHTCRFSERLNGLLISL
jgi:hypothetical protein